MSEALDIDWSLLGDAPLALAVSGGADSFALLAACAERGLPVVALTVDHALREESAADARAVADWCAGRAIPHETLAWEGAKPKTGIQAAARAARYRLLCEACERLGLDRLATGHTLDDQAETVFMRLRRGAGRGLAGMPPSRKIASGPGEPVSLIRPMLGVRRAEARASAEAAGLPVRDDPSNADEGFERVRVRALLGALEEQGLLTAEALGRTARDILARTNLDRTAVASAATELRLEEDASGAWRMDQPTTSEAHQELVRWCVNAASGRQDRVSRHRTAMLPKPWPYSTTIHGCEIANEDGRLTVMREVGRINYTGVNRLLSETYPVTQGKMFLFDGRWIVRVPSGVNGEAVVAPLVRYLPSFVSTSKFARSRISTLPCLAVGERPTHLPAQATDTIREALSGWKDADKFLDGLGTFDARSLLHERFTNAVIRY